MTGNIKLTALRVRQPVGDFFVAAISARILKGLAKADMRRITNRDIEERAGIQRGLNTARLKDIAQYIATVDASFPNSIILNLRSERIANAIELPTVDCQTSASLFCFEIQVAENAFQIIDGQHRLAGFDSSSVEPFDLIIAFFVDLPIEDQAYVFSTINLTQTKVNKSLVYDLFDVSEGRSPQKTCHIVAKAMNSQTSSPFYKRLKLLGVAPVFDGEVLYKAPLSQGTFVDRLIRLISREPLADRDAEKRHIKLRLSGNEVAEGLIFRPFYAEEKDGAILRVMTSYFQSVSEEFAVEWADLNNPLAKTIGYGALMRLLVDLYQEGVGQRDVSYEFFKRRLAETAQTYKRSKRPLNFEEFAAAGSGESALYRALRDWSLGNVGEIPEK